MPTASLWGVAAKWPTRALKTKLILCPRDPQGYSCISLSLPAVFFLQGKWGKKLLSYPATVSNWAKFAVQISKDEALMPLLTVCYSRAFVYLHAFFVCPSCNFENSQHISDSTELLKRTSPEVVNNKQGYKFKSCENPVPICISWDASVEHLLAGCYQAVRGARSKEKEGAVTGSLWQSGLINGLHSLFLWYR